MVATLSLLWQIRNARRARRPFVEVGARLSPGAAGPDYLDLRVTNQSQHTIRWTGIRLFREGHRRLGIFGRPRPYVRAYWNVVVLPPLPLEIPPHDGAEAVLTSEALEALNDPEVTFSEPLGISFELGTGEVIELRPTRYDLGERTYNARSKRGQPRQPM